MLATPRRAISYPNPDRSDRPDIPTHIYNVAIAVDNDVIFNQGTDAQRLAAVHQTSGGRFWWATDTNLVWYDDGAAWHQVGAQPPWNTADISDSAITSAKIADGTIATADIAASAVTSAKIADATIVGTDIAATTIKAANIDETSVATIPVGGMIDWPWISGSIPAWSALPYGQAITQTGHTALTALDTASGHPHGTSAGNIVLPDTRGRTSVGKDDMGGSAANRITAAISGVSGATLGAVFGTEGITLTTAQLPAHNHGITGSPALVDPTHSHSTDAVKTQSGTGAPGGSEGTIFVSAVISPASTGISVNAGSLGTATIGSGSAHQNTQPSIITNKLMRII